MSDSGRKNGSYPPKIEAYVQLVRTAENLHGLVSRGLLTYGLTPSQYSTLKALAKSGPLNQRDIGKRLLKTGGNITMVVDNLERMNLVSREKSADDRRQTIVYLTSKGQDLFNEIYPEHIAEIEHAMKNITEEECAQLSELLNKLCWVQKNDSCYVSSAIELEKISGK